jgi:hypothetical protein
VVKTHGKTWCHAAERVMLKRKIELHQKQI